MSKGKNFDLNMIMDNISDLIIQTDENGCILYVSPSCKNVLGYSQDSLIGKNAFNYIHPDDRSRITALFHKALDKKNQGFVEYRIQHAQGHYIWFETTENTLLNHDGKAVGRIFSCRDLTVKKVLEDCQNTFFDLSSEMLGIANTEGNLVKINNAWKQILGWHTEELLSKPYLSFVHPDDHEITMQVVKQLMEGIRIEGFVNRYLCKNGSYKWISWSSVLDTEGKLIHFSARDVSKQITEETVLKERVRHSEDFLSSVIDNIQGAVYRCKDDQEWTVEYISKGCFGLTGYKPEELIDNAEVSFGSLVQDDYRKWLLSQSNPFYEHEYMITTKKGGKKWVLDRGRKVFSEDGQVIALEGIFTDITERKQLEKKYLASKQRYQSVVETQKEMICRYLPDTTLTFVNDAYCRTYGKQRRDLLGKKYLMFIPPEHHEEELTSLQSLTTSRPIDTRVFHVISPDGSTRWQEWTDVGLFNETEELVEIQGVGRDITDKKIAEQKIKSTVELLQKMQEIAKIGSYTVDLVGDTCHTSDFLNTLLGIEPSENHPFELWPTLIHEEDKDKVLLAHEESIKTGTTFNQDYRIIRKNDHVEVWVNDMGTIELGENGKPSKLHGTIMDITDRKKKTDAEKANAAKSAFLSNMSHEIRTPLSAIVGFTELVLKTRLTPQQKKYVKIIRDSGKTLLGLIGDILDISKLDSDAIELESIPFDLENLILEVCSLKAHAAEEKGLDVIVHIDCDVPNHLIGDPFRLKQILTNLLSNAIKFTDEGEVFIHVKLLKNGGSKALIQFSVTDTGIGLTEEQVKSIFQPFSQGDKSTTREYGGTGLGLAIAQNLVRLMDGDIWVESELNQGAAFCFTTRLDISLTDTPQKYKNAFKNWGMKVLLVENNATSRKMIGDMLTNMSFDVTTSGSKEEALEVLKQSKEQRQYELIIISDKRDKLNGLDLFMETKELFLPSNPPKSIVFYDLNRSEIAEEAEKAGVSATLHKPITPSQLLNTILKVVGKEGFEQANSGLVDETETKDFPKLCGIHVLVVEDNEINQELAKDILKGFGMTVKTAKNGKDALEMVKESTYDIVLMDIHMPVMDGYNATKAIRADPTCSELPIIAMTANATTSDQEKCFAVGMNDFVSKPINTEELFDKIAQLTAPTLNGSRIPSATRKSSHQKAETLPVLEGIDVESTVIRLGGNLKLYKRLLRKFHMRQRNAVEEIQNALDKNDFESAGIITHTLKGAAGNLGAQAVYFAASNLEQELKTRKKKNVAPLLDELKPALVKVFDSITTLEDETDEKDNASGNGGIYVDNLLSKLEELMKLIAEHDFDAVEYLETIITEHKHTFLPNEIMGVKENLEHFDFDNARIKMNAIIKKLQKAGKTYDSE